ncbi:MAG TPA: RidA family protein [Burkholderiales bacterium]|nr:RidA family protein [Burkholderiales bacterium]
MNIIRHNPHGKVLCDAVEHGGFVFLGGQVPTDVNADIKGQTANVLAQIDALLAKAGSGKSKILSCNIWLADMRHREAMNEVWSAWVDPQNLPCRATVEAKLADHRMLVEIACIAAK